MTKNQEIDFKVVLPIREKKSKINGLCAKESAILTIYDVDIRRRYRMEEGQTADDATLIDASDLTISDMGSMGGGMSGENARGENSSGGNMPGRNAPGGNASGGNMPDGNTRQ